jgi:hypothetical protein
MKELEYSKKRLAQQHEDDLEQLLALKKQLEKKVRNACNSVDQFKEGFFPCSNLLGYFEMVPKSQFCK